MTSKDPSELYRGYSLHDMTFSRWISHKANKNGERIFLKFLSDGRTFSYREIDRLSNVVANGFASHGVRKGSHIAVMMDNCPEQAIIYFALGKIGAVSVPVNTAARGELLRYYLHHSDSVAIVAETPYLARCLEVEESLPRIATLFNVELPDNPSTTLTRARAPLVDYNTLLKSSEEPPKVEVLFSDLAMLGYTSGTTGPSKANMLTQAGQIKAGISTASEYGCKRDDVVYISLPINHSNGQWTLLQAMAADASVALSRRFSTSRFWQEVRESGATLTNILGSMVNWLWSQPPSPNDKNHQLRACNMVPVPPFTLEFERRFGARVMSGYGLTDFTAVTSFKSTDSPSKIGSGGSARAGVIIRIADDHDEEVPKGATGEILLRTSDTWSISQGYYKMPDETLAANRNQWFHTGDFGHMDVDGYLFFDGRKKDSIRRRGENISSFEVESVIGGHPGVVDVAVFAVRADTLEDEVAAVIVVKKALSERELVEYCGNNMAHFMVPRFIRFVDQLPRTPTQKIEKYKLKQEVESDMSLMWDRERHGIQFRRQ